VSGTRSADAASAAVQTGPVNSVDALVIGGGPAGLSAALILARALRTVAIADADSSGVHARSTWPQINRNLLGWPDGLPAAQLRELGHQQLQAYPGVTRLESHIHNIEAAAGGFCAETGKGSVNARVVLLATGVEDHYPEFPGWKEYVGRSLHWYLGCDAYEVRGTNIVVIGSGTPAALDALQLRRYSADITVLTGTGPELEPALHHSLRTGGIAVLRGDVASAEGHDGYLKALITSQGDHVRCDHLFSVLPASPRNHLATTLGAATGENGFVAVDTEQRTTIEGVFAAGDITRVHSHQIATALHEGTQAGHAMAHAPLPRELH